MPSIHAKLRTAIAIAIALALLVGAHAADVTVQPAAGSGFVVVGAGGQTRLRVNENGEIVVPVLVNGVQKNLPICVGNDGAIGPCAPNAGGNAPSYTAATGLSLNGTTFSVAPTYQLPQSCAANQIAQWNGTAWACGSASGAAFALPYSGTINDAARVAFAAINEGNNSAILGRSGAASGRFAVAGVWGDATNQLGVWGSSINNVGVWGESTSANGVVGKSDSGHGVYGNSNSGAGVYGESYFFDGVHGQASGTGKAGVAGFSTNGTNGFGVLGGSKNGPGVQGVSETGVGVVGIGEAETGVGITGTANAARAIGVLGTSEHGYGMMTTAPVYQPLNQPGWVKAMLRLERSRADLQGSQKITRCFNSTLPRDQATTPPCGFNVTGTPSVGATEIDFGFNTGQQFVSATNTGGLCSQILVGYTFNANERDILTYDKNGDRENCTFEVIIF